VRTRNGIASAIARCAEALSTSGASVFVKIPETSKMGCLCYFYISGGKIYAESSGSPTASICATGGFFVSISDLRAGDYKDAVKPQASLYAKLTIYSIRPILGVNLSVLIKT
jgi:hypothetical protein